MPTRFRPYHPDQGLLLPPDLRDWLPEGHLAHHVSDLVDGLDLTPFYTRYEGDGRRKSPYEPRMMLKVLIYGYATGVFSSRGLARKLEEDVAFRVLAAGNFPGHRTVCEFRRRHLGDFKRVFVEVVRLAAETGVASFGKLSIDGTKVRANASKRKAMSYSRMLEREKRLEGEIGALLDRAGAVDAEEDARFGGAFRGDELPEELKRREDRLAAIRAAKARLEARQREADDARGRKPGQKRNPKGGRPYKARSQGAGREGARQLHGPGEPDHEDLPGGLPAMLQRPGGGGGEEPVDRRGGGLEQRQRPGPADAAGEGGGSHSWDAPGDGAGRRRVLQRGGPRRARGPWGGRARGPGAGRAGARSGVDVERHPAKAAMAGKLATEAGRAQYAQRKWLSEAPIGWIKETLGFRRFSVRGLDKVQGEWDLVCLALNVKRMQGLWAAC